MSLIKVLDTTFEEVGKTEWPPGSNNTEYGKRYGLNNVPWCVEFLWDCFNRSGERMAFFGGGKTASCGTLFRWYKEQGLTVPVEDIQSGDIVILNFSGTKDTQHCGLVSEVIHNQNGKLLSVKTIEGNTSPGVEGSQDNGGCVALKVRYPKQIVGVCRPMYSEEKPLIDDITNHWAENSIRKAKAKDIMRGYPDGSFKPDQPITRAEVAAILDRLGLFN